MSRILLIDDDAEVRYALGKYMKRAGHEVTEAENGQVGLQLAKQQAFDLVVTDIIMPDVDGIEVVRTLVSRKADLPVIVISGGGRIGKSQYLDLALKLGATAILPKPLDPDELIASIAQHAKA